MSREFPIRSNKGVYTAHFLQGAIDDLNTHPISNAIYIMDRNIARLYAERLTHVLSAGRILFIDANEANKSLDKFPVYIDTLVKLAVRRGQPLYAIGGGIVQDITCFLSSTVMRGLPWVFYPTTLLAQADSCIGSKSSINAGGVKNILGTFNPPEKIVIDVEFLSTLAVTDVQSGLGEMIKVHAIDSPESFDRLARDYDDILNNKDTLERYIYDSLLIKRKLIEIDEFDQGPRNVMNYGHSFGHAIESATDYCIPHGIAVTIGMDLANYVATALGVSSPAHFERMHGVMQSNSSAFRDVAIDIPLLLAALKNDKKNTSTQLRLILPDTTGRITVNLYNYDTRLKRAIENYFLRYGACRIAHLGQGSC